MVLYEFKCDNCYIIWEKNRPIAEYKKGSMCPKCHKKGKKTVGCAVHFKWTDYRSDPGYAEEVYKEQNKNTKESIDSAKGQEYYTRFVPDIDQMKKSGQIKMLGKEVAKAKKKRMENLTKDAYNKMGPEYTKNHNPGQNL